MDCSSRLENVRTAQLADLEDAHSVQLLLRFGMRRLCTYMESMVTKFVLGSRLREPFFPDRNDIDNGPDLRADILLESGRRSKTAALRKPE